jgi:hypothetical protein
MDVATQPFVPLPGFGGDAVTVPFRNQPSQGREVLVHQPNCDAKPAAKFSHRWHGRLPECSHRCLFQHCSSLQNANSASRRKLIAQSRFVRLKDC